MGTVITHYFCEADVIGQIAVQYFPVTDTQEVTNTGAWKWATVLVNATVPGTLILTVEISHNGVNWFPVLIHNLTAVANKWVMVANVALAADTIAALIGISCPAPYIRLGAISGGGADATLTAVFVSIT